MDSLKINTGVKQVIINDDPNRMIEFNPSDVVFAERFYQMVKELETKQGEYTQRAASLETQGVDPNGVPVNIGDSLALTREISEYMREQIDRLFGAGTSTTVFGAVLSLDAVAQFFTGIIPFIQTARSERTTRYMNSQHAGMPMK